MSDEDSRAHGDDVVAIGGKANRPGREIAALGSDARTCRKDRTTSRLPLVVGQERYILVEIGPGPVQLLVALGRSFGGDDSTEVKPCANHLSKRTPRPCSSERIRWSVIAVLS